MFVYDCGEFTLFPTGKFMLTINDGTGNFSLISIHDFTYIFWKNRLHRLHMVIEKICNCFSKTGKKGKREITYVRLDCSHVGLTFET